MPDEYYIGNSVGENGKNLEADVRTVQNLLNSIHRGDGGAWPPLKVDGKCGPKTKAAIQNFQLKQFGWKLADSRVDQEGPTHRRMKLCAARDPWKNATFRVTRKENDAEIAPQGSPILFNVFDDANQRWCLYVFSELMLNAAAVGPLPLLFQGSPFTLRLAHRRRIADLSGTCAIHSLPGEASLTFFLNATAEEPPETVYAGARFNVAGGARYGKFQFITERSWKLGPWNV